jgi:hypothetical protein
VAVTVINILAAVAKVVAAMTKVMAAVAKFIATMSNVLALALKVPGGQVMLGLQQPMLWL